MAGLKRMLIILGSCCIGGGALVAANFGPSNPAGILDPGIWPTLLHSPVAIAGAVLGVIFLLLGVFSNVIQVFGAKPMDRKETKVEFAKVATKADITQMEARFLAVLNRAAVANAPAEDLQTAAAQSAAVVQIFSSTDPLDRPAREAARNLDVDGTISALLKAAEADRSQAARRYREAGALLYRRNVAGAIFAFEQAAKLEPDDFNTWVFLSRLLQSSGNTLQAEKVARGAISKAHNSRDKSCALTDLGDVLARQGDLTGAMQYYSEALVLARERAGSVRADRQNQHDLSISLKKVGDVQYQRGDLMDSLKSYSESLSIIRELSAVDPNVDFRRDLSISLNMVGNVMLQKSDLPSALKLYSESLDIARQLADTNTSDTLSQLHLSIGLNKTGNALLQQGNLPGALKFFSESLDIARKLTLDTSDTRAQRQLSISLNRVGDVFLQMGHLASALESYTDSFNTSQRLATLDKSDVQAQIDLGVSLGKLAQTSEAQGELGKACSYFCKAQAQFEMIAKSTPDARDAKRMGGISAAGAARVCGR